MESSRRGRIVSLLYERCSKVVVSLSAALAVWCQPAYSQTGFGNPAPGLAQPVATRPGFRIGFGDVLQIVVFKEPDASVPETTVRSDGKISMPFIGELTASGLTPSELEKYLTLQLLSYIKDPEVAVLIKSVQSEKVVVVGQVKKGGAIRLGSSMTVLEALSEAGPDDFAKLNSIYVIRRHGSTQVKLPFRYRDVIAGKHLDQNILLEPGDTIVVP